MKEADDNLTCFLNGELGHMCNPLATVCTAECANSSLEGQDPLCIIALFLCKYPSRELPAFSI